MNDDTSDPDPSLVEELRAVTELTRTVPIMVRSVCSDAADRLEALDAERDELAAIVRELAEDCGPPLHPDYGDCAWCEDSYEDMTGREASDHQDSCTWRKACEWAAAHPKEQP